ncbi:hypothetical protein Vadar_026142 [Vaccinium darrowii]|uniref:Uncharacterized protein n=1 Tax=Vaccinium darrowii TaxID=229202 RepID=A0ACB7YZH5_9ERIC|nr:hypothetical protein Vadar_026142 [Vaccinium darrowii]
MFDSRFSESNSSESPTYTSCQNLLRYIHRKPSRLLRRDARKPGTPLESRYMNAMDLGVLSDMPDIRKKACCKLFKQQVYLATWLTEVNIDTYRVDEIFATVGEEMHVSLS